MSNFLSVYITASNAAEADKIAQALVAEKMAACVNIFPAVRSLYRWEGKMHDETEIVLIAKTRMERFEALKNLVKTLHSAACPCIVATPITAGHQPFLTWIVQETTK
jgi:periplasmic divalent cation tolerance protein